jgi:microcystin-dependent protein
MATIVTRAGKGSPLTHNEVDANFTNLNTDKAELASPPFTGTPTAPTATVGTDTTQVATTAFVNAEIANDAPSKTGTGASGTWGISITGDAASVDGKSFGTFTAAGGVAYATDTSTLAATAAGTSGQVLQSNGASAPSWTTLAGIPAGAVATFAMNAAPTGWLKANGAAVSRTTYATLFTAIGTTFGVGDGSTTFNVPDLRGEFIRGWDDARGIDSGRVFGSSQLDQFQGHGHTLTGRQHAAGTGTANEFADTGAAEVYSNTTSVQDPVARSNGTPRTGNETRPRSIALLACIKY